MCTLDSNLYLAPFKFSYSGNRPGNSWWQTTGGARRWERPEGTEHLTFAPPPPQEASPLDCPLARASHDLFALVCYQVGLPRKWLRCTTRSASSRQRAVPPESPISILRRLNLKRSQSRRYRARLPSTNCWELHFKLRLLFYIFRPRRRRHVHVRARVSCLLYFCVPVNLSTGGTRTGRCSLGVYL